MPVKTLWSEVIHIENRTGPKGGSYWHLTLACGHHHAARNSKPKGVRIITAPMRLAPRKVRCYHCATV